eukprot:TRINITY_DN12185_c0_g1_i1.p1 TRINITY_DN12185_c0_g1~~TRINITY_DN12185_c0_g1_i1.p1  ORF type:complete len:325 (+),score=22.92 TRINITY_DN12185_c0_g1_i1:65-1039(+)
MLDRSLLDKAGRTAQEGGGGSIWQRCVEGHDHEWGLVLCFSGILLMVPDATFVRLIHEPATDIAIWRLLLTSVSLTCIVAVRYGWRQLPDMFRSLGPCGVFVSIMGGGANFLFIIAVRLTSVANVVLLLATSSFWAALWSKVFLGMPVPRKTWMAMPIVFGGVILIVSNGLDFGSLGRGEAVAMVIPAMSGLRRTVMRGNASIDMLPALVLGSLLVPLCLLASQQPTRMDPSDLPPLLFNGIICIPLANACLYEGGRYLHPSETSLIMCMETALSPLLAWAVLGDPLTPPMLAGGGLVIATLAAHASWRPATPQSPQTNVNGQA